MYAYIYIYMYVCMCISIYIYIYIYVRVCVCIYIYIYIYIPQPVLALRGSYLGCAQLALSNAFRFGGAYSAYSDGKRNKTNIFLCIRMANVITPM